MEKETQITIINKIIMLFAKREKSMEHTLNTLKRLLNTGITQYHVVEEVKDILTDNGYTMLSLQDTWKLEANKRYFVSPFPSFLVGFVVGNDCSKLRIAASHTDFPMLKFKFNHQFKSNGYIQANIEAYGGLIKESWFDRPLGVAGKIVLKGESAFSPKSVLFDSGKPLFIIPSLAPHLKKDAHTIDVQKEMMPILCCAHDIKGEISENILLDYIADKLTVNVDEILDFDLYLYIDEPVREIGLSESFISAPRIDNISSVAAITDALINDAEKSGLSVGVFYDNEEIGSRSKQGADCILLKEIIDKIYESLGMSRSNIHNAFTISCDVAHGFNPNYPEVYDPTNKAIPGNGIALKCSASQRYVTDSEASAVIKALCNEKEIKYQHIANRSNIAGGQTLGPIMSTFIPAMSADLGIPVLAMHSACELMHKDDFIALNTLVTEYFNY